MAIIIYGIPAVYGFPRQINVEVFDLSEEIQIARDLIDGMKPRRPVETDGVANFFVVGEIARTDGEEICQIYLAFDEIADEVRVFGGNVAGKREMGRIGIMDFASDQIMTEGALILIAERAPQILGVIGGEAVAA